MNEMSVEKWWMKFVTGENGRNPEKTHPNSVSSITKSTRSDRDTNSEPQR